MKPIRERERDNKKIDRGRCKEIYYKELAHVIMEAIKSQDLQVSWSNGDPGKSIVKFQSDACNLKI